MCPSPALAQSWCLRACPSFGPVRSGGDRRPRNGVSGGWAGWGLPPLPCWSGPVTQALYQGRGPATPPDGAAGPRCAAVSNVCPKCSVFRLRDGVYASPYAAWIPAMPSSQGGVPPMHL